jgi:hypothetical protein
MLIGYLEWNTEALTIIAAAALFAALLLFSKSARAVVFECIANPFKDSFGTQESAHRG